MQITARYIAYLIALPTAYLIFCMFYDHWGSDYTWLLIPLMLVLSLIYVFHAQLDQFLIRKQPQLDSDLHQLLRTLHPTIDTLLSNSGHTFHDLYSYSHYCEFTGMGIQSIPDDLKNLVTLRAFHFRAKNKNWPYHYNRIVFYKHPFITPDIQQVHCVETHHDDGVLIFSLEQLIPSLDSKFGQGIFDIALYAFAEAYYKLYPRSLELRDEDLFKRLQEAIGIDIAQLIQNLGIQSPSTYALLAYYCIKRREQISQNWPELLALLQEDIVTDQA